MSFRDDSPETERTGRRVAESPLPARSTDPTQLRGFQVGLEEFSETMRRAFLAALRQSREIGGEDEPLKVSPPEPEAPAPEPAQPEPEGPTPVVEGPPKDPKALEYYYDPGWRLKTKQQLINEFDRIGAQYIEYADEDTKDLIKRLDLIKKLQAQNRAMASYVKGEQKAGAGFTPTSMFSSEKITAVASNGSPIGKVISFTNGIDQVTIKADGNGGYYAIQGGQKYGPRTYKEIERWAYLGGFQASAMKVLKNVADLQRDPDKLKAVVFRARKL
jgi:hypothetical protein